VKRLIRFDVLGRVGYSSAIGTSLDRIAHCSRVGSAGRQGGRW
jgi:hypothetical protein